MARVAICWGGCIRKSLHEGASADISREGAGGRLRWIPRQNEQKLYFIIIPKQAVYCCSARAPIIQPGICSVHVRILGNWPPGQLIGQDDGPPKEPFVLSTKPRTATLCRGSEGGQSSLQMVFGGGLASFGYSRNPKSFRSLARVEVASHTDVRT